MGTHLKRPWCWERLKAGEGDNRGWDVWVASQTQWTWVWVGFQSWWWAGKPGVLQSMGSQRVGHDLTELNWTEQWNNIPYLNLFEYWSFSFSVSPSNEYLGMISFRMDWLDLLVVQGTLKSLLQHHHSRASILRLSAFYIVQLSPPYMTTGKMIALTRRIFVAKSNVSAF